MTQWFLSYNGTQEGPFDLAQARQRVYANPEGYAWREGYASWIPLREVQELIGSPVPSGVIPPPPGGGDAVSPGADPIEYRLCGSEMQYVEVALEPGRSVVAESGSMMFKDACIQMEAIFGDGSASPSGSFVDKLWSAGKRVLTGESLFMTQFSNAGTKIARVAFASPYPGNVLPMDLAVLGGTLICQKDSFLCAARGVSIGIFFQKKILTGLFGGEGFIMQRLDGRGMVFVHAGGTVVERDLQAGEMLHVDTGCVVAFEPRVQFDVEQAGNIKTAFFGGEGLFLAVLRGPGRVWLQSLPFSRLAGRMHGAAPQNGGGKEEGSLLGGLGNLLDGDNR